MGAALVCLLVGAQAEAPPEPEPDAHAQRVDARAERISARNDKAARSARVHHLSIDAAPLYHALWHMRHEDDEEVYGDNYGAWGGSDYGLGLKLAYGHRFTRRMELSAGVEYLRHPTGNSSAQHIRLTATPLVVFGSGRYYDISLGTRLGFSAIEVDGWAPQVTTLLVVRNRFWVHENVGLLLSGSSGVHWSAGRGTKGLISADTAELIAVRIGIEVRFGPRGWSHGRKPG